MEGMKPGQAVRGFCAETANIWQFVGTILLVFKIVIPIILIILGMIELGKAVISSDEKAIGKSFKTFAYRLVAAVIIFFIPSIVSAIFSLIGNFNTQAKDDYNVCKTCITNPNGGDANTAGTCQYYVSKVS